MIVIALNINPYKHHERCSYRVIHERKFRLSLPIKIANLHPLMCERYRTLMRLYESILLCWKLCYVTHVCDFSSIR